MMLGRYGCASCVGVVVGILAYGSCCVGVVLGGATELDVLSFLSLIVEKVWRVDEVPPFVCLQCLRMGRQGKDFGGRVVIRVRRWWRFPRTIYMSFFRSVGKTLQCQRLVHVRCVLHTRCGSDNYLMPGRCINLHIRVLPKLLLLQVYHG